MKLIQPDDWHVHFRNGEIAETVVPLHAKVFNRCLVMPNMPVIDSVKKGVDYRNYLECISNFTIKSVRMLTEDLTPDDIVEEAHFFTAYKLYPRGVTTGSDHGIKDVKALGPIFDCMQKCGLVLCIHAEDPDSPILLQREYLYHDNIKWIANNFPSLRIIIEHISDRRTIDLVDSLHKNVAGTITIHHLLCTMDHCLNNVHYRCNPIMKFTNDKYELRNAVRYNKGKYFLGTDSAPHKIKVNDDGTIRAGVFMPGEIAMSCLIDLIEYSDVIEKFTSRYGAQFYRVPINEKEVQYIKKPWIVPKEYNGIVPFMAGQQMNWRLAQ